MSSGHGAQRLNGGQIGERSGICMCGWQYAMSSGHGAQRLHGGQIGERSGICMCGRQYAMSSGQRVRQSWEAEAGRTWSGSRPNCLLRNPPTTSSTELGASRCCKARRADATEHCLELARRCYRAPRRDGIAEDSTDEFMQNPHAKVLHGLICLPQYQKRIACLTQSASHSPSLPPPSPRPSPSPSSSKPPSP